MSRYDNPTFLVITEKALAGTISAAGVASAYVGSSLKVANKAVVLGCTVRIGSAGSASGTNSIKIARIGTGGTISNMQVFTLAPTDCSAGIVNDLSLTAGFTVHSLGEAAAVVGVAASLDKVVVLSDVIWRYRILPYDIPQTASNK